MIYTHYTQRPVRYDLMRKAAQPYLQPDETIQAIFRATTAGRSGRAVLLIAPWVVAALAATRVLFHSFAAQVVILLTGIAVLYAVLCSILRYRYLVVTSHRILVLNASLWNTKAHGIRAELPRSTRLGPASGRWYVIRAGDENLHVNEKYFDDIAVADDPAHAAPWRTRCVSCGRIIGPQEAARLVSDMEWAHTTCPPETGAVGQDIR